MESKKFFFRCSNVFFFLRGGRKWWTIAIDLVELFLVFFDGMASPQDATRPSKVALMRLFFRETHMRNGGL